MELDLGAPEGTRMSSRVVTGGVGKKMFTKGEPPM